MLFREKVISTKVRCKPTIIIMSIISVEFELDGGFVGHDVRLTIRVLYNKKPPPSRSGGQFRRWSVIYVNFNNPNQKFVIQMLYYSRF
jgi:hypothetical protein